jgi:hypothetical protein
MNVSCVASDDFLAGYVGEINTMQPAQIIQQCLNPLGGAAVWLTQFEQLDIFGGKEYLA